jgi:hypothetical protein
VVEVRGDTSQKSDYPGDETMRDDLLLTSLETLADQLRIPVTYAPLATDDLPGRGGLCVLHGERRIIIERTLSIRQKARLLASGLAEFDFGDVFILPAVRQAIEEANPKLDHSPDG